ncbi:hypothetical protein HNY73_008618 [Argiope bruennichi]|uniref:Uncharacterized protein n=1 Tax=Argiope bruennichi TaxID=94029 RepID=A0A8T0F9U3_ARGBR|nr:hypothetical protein HNY73_008618 [Argiope bruennichi]
MHTRVILRILSVAPSIDNGLKRFNEFGHVRIHDREMVSKRSRNIRRLKRLAPKRIIGVRSFVYITVTGALFSEKFCNNGATRVQIICLYPDSRGFSALKCEV